MRFRNWLLVLGGIALADRLTKRATRGVGERMNRGMDMARTVPERVRARRRSA